MEALKDKTASKCLYVATINKDSSDINERFKKLGASFDGVGWSIPEKYTKEVVEICQKENLVCIEQQSESIAPSRVPNDSNKTPFSYLLDNNSEQKLIDELKNISEGIATGFIIGEIDLKFHGGVVSIIAAPTSHGKTSALINFSLGALRKNPKKGVYFFSYEESSASILSLFINTFIGEKLSKNNRESIISYFREASTQYIIESMRDQFVSIKQIFFETLINTGHLKIFYSDMPANELIDAIHFIKQNDPNVGLICIDYMQLLKLYKNNVGTRQEELKQICLMLKDCAISTGLPIVLTAQFNRTVVTEADLSSVNIGEAGDIERIASLIIGMFNRNFVLNREGNHDKNGELIAKESAIYFEVLKGRGIGNGHNTVMDFDGNTGKLTNRSNVLEGFHNMNTRTQNRSIPDKEIEF